MIHLSYSLGVEENRRGTTQMARLLLKNVELQAKEKGLLIEKVSGGYIVDEIKFKTLQAVVDYLEVVVIPTAEQIEEAQQAASEEVNFKLLKEVLEFFKKHPEQHHQGCFARSNPTQYCIAGRAVETVLPGYCKRYHSNKHMVHLAQKLTGLTVNQAHILFMEIPHNATAITALTDIVALEGKPPSVVLPAINELLTKHQAFVPF
jgi:hypothetical protein